MTAHSNCLIFLTGPHASTNNCSRERAGSVHKALLESGLRSQNLLGEGMLDVMRSLRHQVACCIPCLTKDLCCLRTMTFTCPLLKSRLCCTHTVVISVAIAISSTYAARRLHSKRKAFMCSPAASQELEQVQEVEAQQAYTQVVRQK